MNDMNSVSGSKAVLKGNKLPATEAKNKEAKT